MAGEKSGKRLITRSKLRRARSASPRFSAQRATTINAGASSGLDLRRFRALDSADSVSAGLRAKGANSRNRLASLDLVNVPLAWRALLTAASASDIFPTL